MERPKHHFDLVHVTTVHRALDTRIFYREARSAQKAGLRVSVVGPHETLEIVNGVLIVPLKTIRSRILRRIFSPLSAVYKIMRLRPRIVHFHDPEFIVAAVFLKLLRYKIIWDVHEYYSEVQTAHMNEGLLREIKRSLISAVVEKAPCAFFDRSVFPTNALREAIAASSHSIACVNLLPVDEFPDQGSKCEKEYDLVFMGAMSPFRAGPFLDLVALLRQKRPSFRVVLLGVPEATQAWMIANATSPEVLDSMTFLPRVPHAQVAGLLRKARIGFNYHPMQKRFQVALPMKVYEYMACGIPVVCSRFPELVTQMREGEMVLVDGDDTFEYAGAISDLLENAERMERIGRMGNDAVRRRLNWEGSEAPKLIAMYHELLALR